MVKKAAGEVADGMNVAGTALDDATEKVKTAGDVWSRIFTGLAHPFKEGNWKEFSEGGEEMIAHPHRSAGAAAKDMLIELGPMGAFGVAVGATFAELGKKAYELVNEEGAAARQTQNLANRLGLTFEQAKKLSEMARIVDTDIGSLARAAFKLSDALQNRSSKRSGGIEEARRDRHRDWARAVGGVGEVGRHHQRYRAHGESAGDPRPRRGLPAARDF